MYARLEKYSSGCSSCGGGKPSNAQKPFVLNRYTPKPKKYFIDSPQLRLQRRGGGGIDSYQNYNISIKEEFSSGLYPR